MPRLSKGWKYGIFALVVGLLVLWLVFFGDHPQDTAGLRRAEQEMTAKVFGFTSYRKRSFYPENAEFFDGQGRSVHLQDFQGSYLILNLWASFCPPCLKELPALERLRADLERDGAWRVIAVSVDAPRQKEKAQHIVKEQNIEGLAGYFDEGSQLQNALRITSLPATYILSPKGQILYGIQGDAQWDQPEIKAFFGEIQKAYKRPRS